jgi:hypothetical protein
MGLCASRREPAQTMQQEDAVPVYQGMQEDLILSPSFISARQHLRQLMASSWKERGNQRQRTRSTTWAQHSRLARWTWLVQCRLLAHVHHERSELLKDLKRSLQIEST